MITFWLVKTAGNDALLDHEAPAERLVLYSSTKLLSATGQDTLTRFDEARWIESNGSGSTMTVLVKALLAGVGSEKSLPALAMQVIVPAACGTTVRVTVAEPPMPRLPMLARMGLPLVARVP